MRNPRQFSRMCFFVVSATPHETGPRHSIKVRTTDQVKQRNWACDAEVTCVIGWYRTVAPSWHSSYEFLAAKKHGSEHGLEILKRHAQGPDHDRDAVAARSLQCAAHRRAFRAEQDIRRFFRRSGAMGR